MTDQPITEADLAMLNDKSWYIRTGLDRSIAQTIDKIHDLATMCDNAVKTDQPRTPYAGLYNFAYYEIQWVRESLLYFSTLPEAIRPIQSRRGFDYDLALSKIADAQLKLDSLKEHF